MLKYPFASPSMIKHWMSSPDTELDDPRQKNSSKYGDVGGKCKTVEGDSQGQGLSLTILLTRSVFTANWKVSTGSSMKITAQNEVQVPVQLKTKIM